jgi:CheY-like chemotaxis protein
MVYGLIKQSGGHIQIYSEVGEGTTIRIYFPRVFQEEAAKTVELSGPITGGSETILVVEDDDDVRDATVEMLADLGYRVLKARDASGALAIILSGVSIDLLFSDVVMPGPVQSRDMARKAQERFPGIAILFASCYTENAIVHGGRLDEGVELLSKPYIREALARKVRQCIQGSLAEAHPDDSVKSVDAAADVRSLAVLLVEDEVLVRMATAEMLADLGHRVIEASTGEEAVATLETGRVDVLVTDIGLPGMSGTALAAIVQKRWPDVAIVIASGLAEGDDVGLADAAGRVAWLPKPYDIPDLVRVLDRLKGQG